MNRTDRRRAGEVRVAVLDRRRSGGGGRGPGRDPDEPPGGDGLAYIVAGAVVMLSWAVVAFNLGV
jgi:hypothetical protein